METKDYKEEIAQTRVGCLGSSDGRMLAQIASLGCVPHSAIKRLAIVKGLVPQTEIPQTDAIRTGDEIEMQIFHHLSTEDPRYISNQMWVSERYSRKNVKLISHPDLVLRDDERKTLFVYEVKTTKFGVKETKQTYKAQLFIHYIIAKEIAKKLGDKWKVKLILVHYSTDGLDLAGGITFDPTRLTLHGVSFNAPLFDIGFAMDYVDTYLESLTEYYEGDEVDADLLPQKVKEEFDLVAATLLQIKKSEKMVNDFKSRLYLFMQEKGIRSVKNDVFAISCVSPSTTKSFDGKQFLDDLAKEHPRKANKIRQKYTKTSQKKGYAVIKLKEEK